MHLCTCIHKHTYSQNELLRVHRQNMSVSCCWAGLKGESSIKLLFLYRNFYPKRSVKTAVWKIPSCFIPPHFCVESWTLKYTDLTWVLWLTCCLFVLGMWLPYHKAWIQIWFLTTTVMENELLILALQEKENGPFSVCRTSGNFWEYHRAKHLLWIIFLVCNAVL